MRTLQVTGVGRQSKAVDLIVLKFNLNVLQKEYSKAVDLANQKFEALKKALTFSDKDYKTAQYGVNTEYRYEERNRVFEGYRVGHDFSLSFAFDMKKLASVISAMSSCGCDIPFTIQFTINDKESLKENCLKTPVADGQAKAQILAASGGVKLKNLVNIEYHNTKAAPHSETRMVMLMEASDNRANITPEDVESSETVTLIYEIE